MNKNYIYLILIAVLVVGGFFVFSQPTTTRGVSDVTSSAGQNSLSLTGDVQIVRLSVSNGQYIMSPSTLTKGKTVRLVADMNNMPGCSKSIVISAFNVRKTFTTASNTVEFTPDKTGTFNIACSMNMYRGTFSVVDSSGTKSNYVEPAPSGGGSCGGSGGGCGCGG